MTFTRTFLISSLVAASAFSQAQQRTPRTPIFIAPSLVDAVSAITPPPALDSKKMSRDIAEICSIQRSATPQELERANWDNKHEDIFAIGTALGGDKFNKEFLSAVAALWADMSNDQSIVVSAAKKYFQHPRPYDLDSNIQSVCGSKPGGARNSYPSGHGTVGYLSAIVLTMMVPEKDEYAHKRVVCGDHYPADVVGSRQAAEMIFGNMATNPKFREMLATAKMGLRKPLGL